MNNRSNYTQTAPTNGKASAGDISVKAHRLAAAAEKEEKQQQISLEHSLQYVDLEEDLADVQRDEEETGERILDVGSPIEEEIKVRLKKGGIYLALFTIFATCAIGLIDAALQAVFYHYWPALRVLFACGFALSPIAVFHYSVKRFSRLDEDGRPILSKTLVIALLIITSLNLTAWSLLRNTFVAARDEQSAQAGAGEDSFAEDAERATMSSAAVERRGAFGHVVGAVAIDAAGAVTGCFGISLLFAKVKGASNLAIWLMYRRRRRLRARELQLRKDMRKLAIIAGTNIPAKTLTTKKGR